MAKSRVTLKDVANRVGVHSSTVSRVLNSKTRNMVTEEIADKILSVVAEIKAADKENTPSRKTISASPRNFNKHLSPIG